METNNKLREALDDIIDKIDTWRSEGSMEHWQYSQLFDIADAALAEPVKNYEVGTVAQQAKRLEEYCESEEVCKRKRCKSRAKALCIERCALAWAQLPFVAGGEK